MAAIEVNMPPVDEEVDGHWCAHEYVPGDGRGYYLGAPHAILEFWGGRPGYSACTLDPGLDLDAVMRRAAKAGWERVAISDCGYGDGEPHPATVLTREKYLLIEAVAQKHGLRFQGTAFKSESEPLSKARRIAGAFVGLRFDVWEAWVAYVHEYGLENALRFAAEAEFSSHLTPGRRSSYHTIVAIMKQHKYDLADPTPILWLISLFLMDRMRCNV